MWVLRASAVLPVLLDLLDFSVSCLACVCLALGLLPAFGWYAGPLGIARLRIGSRGNTDEGFAEPLCWRLPLPSAAVAVLGTPGCVRRIPGVTLVPVFAGVRGCTSPAGAGSRGGPPPVPAEVMPDCALDDPAAVAFPALGLVGCDGTPAGIRDRGVMPVPDVGEFPTLPIPGAVAEAGPLAQGFERAAGGS
jgi:hypothetical protein